MKYVIRATHEDGRRFCKEVEVLSGVITAIGLFNSWLIFSNDAELEQLTTIDIDRMDDEPTSTTP